jgi:cyclopropane-fatty-acyl-phospholipid synthase
LDEAEEAMLQLTVQRAELASGQEILELGCGWGSLTLFMAAQFPDARITAVSNSASQRLFIEEKAKQRGLTNVKVLTCDMNHFHTEGQFDRVVSVEMFEHMRNYQELLKRISLWLKPTGLLFVHIFTHHSHTYAFESQGRDGDWMSDYFFTGGLMPGAQLLPRFQRDLTVIRQDTVNGIHYQKTARAWLDRFDAHRNQILPIMASVYGKKEAVRWSERWRLFFMACEECFGYNSGREWPVHHYLFRKVESGGSKE